MLQIIHCDHASERTEGARLCIACEVRNTLLRMEQTIDRREPQHQLPLVSSAN